MKNWTKKFLKSKSVGDITLKNISTNAKKAKKNLNVPEELYLELSDKFPESNLRHSLESANLPSTFMAGFVVGWAEKNRKTK